MLDIKFLRTNFEEVKAKLQHRGEDLTDFGRFEELDTRRRELLVQTEELKSKRNGVSERIAKLKREKQDANELISENQFIIMAREGIDMLKAISHSPLLRNYDDGRFQLLDKGLAMEISSTYIRQEFARGGEPRYLMPDLCYFYSKKHGLYQ